MRENKPDLTLEHPRSIIASAPNLRDLGGYATRDGGQVRTGRLYRSEQLSRISEADRLALGKLGLKKIYDLRTVDERTAEPDRVPAGAQYLVLDVLADEKQAAPGELMRLFSDPQKVNARLSGGKAEAMFMKTYVGFISLPSARAGFARLFNELVDMHNLPALFHCTTGKDRTGWAAAALLTLCGVSHDDVLHDYLLSNDYILPEYAAIIQQTIAVGIDEGIMHSLLGVRREYLQAAFEAMQQQFGGIEDYFAQGLGIDRTDQQAIRLQCIEYI